MSERLPEASDREGVTDSKAVTFLQWLLSSEELPSVSSPAAGGALPRRSLRWLVEPEELPEEPGESLIVERPGRAFWNRLVSGEELPQEEASATGSPRRPGFLRWVLTPEACPRIEPADRGDRRGFAHWLMAPDVCPVSKASTPARRRGFLRSLLSRKEL